MTSNKDSTVAEPQLQQISIRIPEDLYKTVAKEAIDRDTTSQQLWIDAMRKFLKLAA